MVSTRNAIAKCFLILLTVQGVSNAEQVVWIGTSPTAEGVSQGIYRATLDDATGEISTPELAAEIDSAGFVALSSDGNLLYSVCNLANGEGGVAAFEVTAGAKSLELLNTQPTGDGGAAHICLDRTGRALFTAQYGGGSVAGFPIDNRGRIGARTVLVEHSGKGPDASRQEGPHPHWVGVDPTNRFLMVPDLGIDEVVVYEMTLPNVALAKHGSGRCPPGSGPRHLKFHPNGKLAYVVNELGLSITAFRYDAEAGTLQEFQTITTLPEPLRELPNWASEIRIHPNGRFLYAANRGHDSIAAFAIDPSDGTLKFVEHEAVRGSHPRNFNIDLSGKWLLAAGRDSNTIAVFAIDQETGGLVFTGESVYCPAPICIELQQP